MKRCEPSASSFVGNFDWIVDGQEKSEELLSASCSKRLAMRLTAEFSKNTQQRAPRCSRARKRGKSPPAAFQLCVSLRQGWENWRGGKTEKWPEGVPQAQQHQMCVNRPRAKPCRSALSGLVRSAASEGGGDRFAKMMPRLSPASQPASSASESLPQRSGQQSAKFSAFRSKLSEQDRKINTVWRPT